MASAPEPPPASGFVATPALSGVVVPLLKGVVYRDNDTGLWDGLVRGQAQVRDYVAVLGLDLVLDEAEGHAFLRSRPAGDAPADAGGGEGPERAAPPRLVARRPLSFPVSLLLALLRKKLAEFDAGGGDTRLVLTRDEIVEMVRVFLPDSSNEARLVDRIDAHVNRVVELGFLRRMRTGPTAPARTGARMTFEVRRILKAFVDAQWLAEFDTRLAEYRALLEGEGSGSDGAGGRSRNGGRDRSRPDGAEAGGPAAAGGDFAPAGRSSNERRGDARIGADGGGHDRIGVGSGDSDHMGESRMRDVRIGDARIGTDDDGDARSVTDDIGPRGDA